MGPDKSRFEKKKHLFQVEILVEEPTHMMALAALLQALNHPHVADFRIMQGIQFGKEIEKTLKESKGERFAVPPHQAVPVKVPSPNGSEKADPGKPGTGPAGVKPSSGEPAGGKTKEPAPSKKPDSPIGNNKSSLSFDNLADLQEKGTLVRIVAVKEKGIRLSIPCRILRFDSDGQQLTIYHVDEKKVYSFNLNEIEDIITG